MELEGIEPSASRTSCEIMVTDDFWRIGSMCDFGIMNFFSQKSRHQCALASASAPWLLRL
jgi:hypothetical protein